LPGSKERFPDSLFYLGCHSWPTVANRDQRLAIQQSGLDLNTPTLGGRLNRVEQEVGHRIAHGSSSAAAQFLIRFDQSFDIHAPSLGF
jgi:hypothetical protein